MLKPDVKFLIAGLMLLSTTPFAQVPDPRDSVIIESKTLPKIIGGCQSALLKVKVWITNKDTLSAINFPLELKTLFGTASAILSRSADCISPRTFADAFNILLPPGQLPVRAADFSRFNDSSPDTVWAGLSADANADSTRVPPNPARVPLLDIKFDVSYGGGQFQIDSALIPPAQAIQFINAGGVPLKVNFVKGLLSGQAVDPRDSIILESKLVSPLSGPCASAGLRVKVWITNKDSLAIIPLPLGFRSVYGGAYGILSRTAGCARPTLTSVAFDFLYPPGPRAGGQRLSARVANYFRFNSISPDTVLFAFTLDNPGNDDGKLPPNLTRQLLGELKFDSVQGNIGQFEINAVSTPGSTSGMAFVSLGGEGIYPNFVKSTITVVPPVKGDLNLDGVLNSVDIIQMLNCVFLGTTPPAGRPACDVNCNGEAGTLDYFYQFNVVYGFWSYPCP